MNNNKEPSFAVSENEWNRMMSMLIDIGNKVTKLSDQAAKERLTPKEVQNMLRIGKSTYQRYVDNGLFEQKKIGGKAYVYRSEIERLIEKGKI